MNKLETSPAQLSTQMQSSSKSPNPSPDPDIDDASSKRQATRCVICQIANKSESLIFFFLYFFRVRVFKKSSANGKITVYLGKRDFVDHITHVDPIGEFLFCFWIILITKIDDEDNCGHSRLFIIICVVAFCVLHQLATIEPKHTCFPTMIHFK